MKEVKNTVEQTFKSASSFPSFKSTKQIKSKDTISFPSRIPTQTIVSLYHQSFSESQLLQTPKMFFRTMCLLDCW
jgi:hypothetical protein